MLIFDVLDEQLILSTELKDKTLSEYPDRYIYLMDYLDMQDLVHKTGRFLRDQEASEPIQPMDMVAASWAKNYKDCTSVICPILESPYAVVYFADAFVTKDRLQQLIDTTVSLAGKLIGGVK